MQPTGINPGLLRVLAQHAPDLLTEMLTPGKVLDAEVISRYGDKAIISFGRNLRIEVTLQAPLVEGQKVKVQVQTREQPAPPGESRAPILLKVVSEQAQGEKLVYVPVRSQQPIPSPGQAPSAAQTAPQNASASQATPGAPQLAAALQLPDAPLQPPTQTTQQAGQPQVLWLPIPLPQGGQAWAQVHVQEENARKGRAVAGPVHQVRIFWETPGLGPVQVTMDASATALTALFTTAAVDVRTALEQHLPELQQRLNEAGYTETRLGARQPMPGEAVEPVRSDEAGRLNVRA